MVKEIVKGDSCSVAVVSLVNEMIKKEKENGLLKKKTMEQNNVIEELTMSDVANQSINKNLNQEVKKYKKQKNVFKLIALGLFVGLLVK